MAGRGQAVRPALAPLTARSRRDRRPTLVFWASTLVIAITAMARNAYLFTTPIHEQGDEALNSLLVVRAEHFQQLVGNYSRVGFHHPGPALFYVLAAGQAFFHGLLHVAAAPYNGELLGGIVFNAVLVGLVVLVIYRATRSVPAAALAFGGIFAFAARELLLGDGGHAAGSVPGEGIIWFPYLYVAPFLLFMVAGAALAAGHTVELPAYVLAAGLLAHGHVSFLMFVAVTTVGVAVCWFARHRRGWRGELGTHRRGAIGSLVLLAVFLLPITVELALHYPGPWRGYLDYLDLENAPRTAGEVARFTRWYWTAGVPLWLTIVALVVGAALMIRERRRIFAFLYGMCALQTALFVYYVARGVDYLDTIDRYVGFFYLTVPLLLVVTAGVQLTVRLAGSAPSTRVLAVAAAAALVGLAASVPQAPSRYREGTQYDKLVAALANDPARGGRTVALEFEHSLWPQAAGVGIAAQRAGLPWCVGRGWTNMVTHPYICRAQQPHWAVALWPARSAPAGTTVVWHDTHLAVVVRTPRPAAAAREP